MQAEVDKPSTLILADDEPMNLTILARVLEKYGFSTVDAHNGEEVVRIIRELAESHKPMPSAVLMDINMPKMNGVEATRILKAEFPQLPIIAVTALKKDDFLYADVGFDGFFRKPVNYSALVKTLHDFTSVPANS